MELQFLAPGQEVKELSEAAIIKAAMTNGRLCQITKNRDRQKIQTLFPEPEVIVRKTREIETREKRLTFVLPEGKGNKQHVARDEYEFLPGNPRQAEIRAALGPYGIAELGVARFSRMIRGCVVSIKHAGVHEVQCYATDTTKGSEAALFNYCSMNGINLRFLKKRDFA